MKEEGGIKLADAIHTLVVGQIVGDENMQTEMESNCSQSLGKFMDAINSNKIEEVMQYCLSPCNVQKPVWTRWMTIVKAAIMAVDNWSQIYTTLIAIKNSEKALSHLPKWCQIYSL